MNPMWFIRMKRWAQNPPSARRMIMVAVVAVACLSLYWLEQYGLLPDWMAAERVRLRP